MVLRREERRGEESREEKRREEKRGGLAITFHCNTIRKNNLKENKRGTLLLSQ